MTITKKLALCVLLCAPILVIAFADEEMAGLRFLSKLLILGLLASLGISAILINFFGRNVNRKVWAAAGLVLIPTSIALIAAEFTVRMVYFDITTTADNSSYFARRWRDRNPIELNSLGFREREFSVERREGDCRIAVIGDSFAFGQGISIEERFSNLIESRLGESGNPCEVLNFGRPGAETDDHAEILANAVLPADPDFVLLQWYVNDVQILDSNEPPPVRLVPSDYAHSWLHSHSALYYLADRGWQAVQVAVGFRKGHIESMTDQFSDPQAPSWQAASSALTSLFRIVKSRNLRTGMVLFPMMVDAQGSREAYPLGFLMDRILDVCDREQISCLDLRPALAEISPDAGLWANRLDHHPGPGANAAAARAILEAFGTTWANNLPDGGVVLRMDQ